MDRAERYEELLAEARAKGLGDPGDRIWAVEQLEKEMPSAPETHEEGAF